MSTDDKNERNDEHWNDIINIVKRNNPKSSDSKTTELKGTDMSHDEAIFDFISSEVERTSSQTNAPANASVSSAPLSWPDRVSRFFTETLFPKSPAGGARGFAVAALCALVVIPFVYQGASNNNADTVAFEIPTSVLQVANDTREHIDYSGSNIGLASNEQSDIVKAFMTGVVHSDIKIIDSYDAQNTDQLKKSLYEYHSADVVQTNATPENAESAYKESLTLYANSDSHKKWLYKGMALELIYLTANVGLDTKAYQPLADMLERYKSITQNNTYEDQSEEYYKEHELILSYADKAISGALTDNDIKSIRKHARNMKVRIQ